MRITRHGREYERGYSDEEREIISIRAQLLDEEPRTVGKFLRDCEATVNPILSNYIVNLTGITQDMVNSASYFPEVYQLSLIFVPKHVLFIVMDETNTFMENMNLYATCSNYEFLLKCKDIRPIFMSMESIKRIFKWYTYLCI